MAPARQYRVVVSAKWEYQGPHSDSHTCLPGSIMSTVNNFILLYCKYFLPDALNAFINPFKASEWVDYML